MPSTGRHSYFNISNSNYKSLIDPQRLVEITAWNRMQTTESCAIDHCWHWCNEGKKINKLLKTANNTFKPTDNRGFWYPWVDTGGTGTEQSNPCSENDAQWFRGLVSHLILPPCIGSFRLLHCHNPDVKKVLSPPGSAMYVCIWVFERSQRVWELEAVGRSVSV